MNFDFFSSTIQNNRLFSAAKWFIQHVTLFQQTYEEPHINFGNKKKQKTKTHSQNHVF